jgi:hypothetical protein
MAVLVLAVLCLPSIAEPQARSRWRPEERTVIGEYGVVVALAAGQDYLYAFTASGIGVYDTRLRRWDLPRPTPPGVVIPPGSPALVDPLDRSVWIGTAMGVLHYDPRLEITETV